MIKRLSYHINFGQLALAQVLVGLNIVILKYLTHDMPTFLILGIRFLIGALVLLPICFLKKQSFTRKLDGTKLKLTDISILFLQAACGGFLFNVLMVAGINHTSAITAGIVSSVIPVMIAVMSWALLKEKLSRFKLMAIVLACFGIAVLGLSELSGSHAHVKLFGLLLILASMVPESLFTVIAKWHGQVLNPLITSTYVAIFNAILFLPMSTASLKHYRLSQISAWDWCLLGIYGAGGGIFFFILWYQGLQKTQANTAALFTAIAPVSVTLFGYLFLHESLSMMSLLGMLLVISSIFIGSKVVKKN